MSVVTHGTARIRRSDTGVVYSIDPDELDRDVNGSDEREMAQKSPMKPPSSIPI